MPVDLQYDGNRPNTSVLRTRGGKVRGQYGTHCARSTLYKDRKSSSPVWVLESWTLSLPKQAAYRYLCCTIRKLSMIWYRDRAKHHTRVDLVSVISAHTMPLTWRRLWVIDARCKYRMILVVYSSTVCGKRPQLLHHRSPREIMWYECYSSPSRPSKPVVYVPRCTRVL